MKRQRRFVNPHRETLGCEVNVCQAKTCSPAFMERCALRKAWHERKNELIIHWRKCRTKKTRRIYEDLLEQLGVRVGE